MDSHAGQLLIASPTLLDPNFEQTVGLIVRHDEDGALGLVLNRATPVPLAQAWSEVSDTAFAGEDLLLRGGPCEGPLMVLHAEQDHAQLQVADGVYFSAETERVTAIVEANAQPALYFVGYAGWAPGQLEDELETGAWWLAPAESATVFLGPKASWGKLVSSVDPGSPVNRIDPRLMPDDPSLN
ncbi:MAG: YqgE/AlgH family protein [Planctomycetota bacterium]